jgi:hypothetical protein
VTPLGRGLAPEKFVDGFYTIVDVQLLVDMVDVFADGFRADT